MGGGGGLGGDGGYYLVVIILHIFLFQPSSEGLNLTYFDEI